MSAVVALTQARAAGIQVGIDGEALVLEASAPPPAGVLDLLARHKADILTLLRPGDDGWSGEDWREFFDERAGIAEFDGGLPRDQAEARAFSCCVGEWLHRNPVRSPVGALRPLWPVQGHVAALSHRLFGERPRTYLAAPGMFSRVASGTSSESGRGVGGEWDHHSRQVPKRFRQKRSRVMGGFGSGRPSGSGRDKVEHCRSIDVNKLHKAGCLTPGWTRGWQWTQDGKKVASINLRAETVTGCIFPIACALPEASGKTSMSPSASSACHAASAVRGPISSVPASSTASPAAGAS